MKNKFQLLLILSLIIISFPSICFSESKTVEGEYCDVYLGDMKNKKELGDFRKTVKTKSIENGLNEDDGINDHIYDFWIDEIISKYIEKVMVVSHTENGRKICDKVKITFDPEVINKYLDIKYNTPIMNIHNSWETDINNVLIKKNNKINIGLIIETKIPDIDGYKRERLENGQESQFFQMIEENKDKYKVIDRRHLGKVLEEQKLSSSGITDSETVKLGKILNLDIIVLRLIYKDNNEVTKVLKVDTGEVLLFKTYKPEPVEIPLPLPPPPPPRPYYK